MQKERDKVERERAGKWKKEVGRQTRQNRKNLVLPSQVIIKDQTNRTERPALGP